MVRTGQEVAKGKDLSLASPLPPTAQFPGVAPAERAVLLGPGPAGVSRCFLVSPFGFSLRESDQKFSVCSSLVFNEKMAGCWKSQASVQYWARQGTVKQAIWLVCVLVNWLLFLCSWMNHLLNSLSRLSFLFS